MDRMDVNGEAHQSKPRPRNLSISVDHNGFDGRPPPDLDNDPVVQDARRAWQQGDFTDIKQALWTMLTKVDELSMYIRTLLAEQEDLRLNLTVAQSNLTLALSNTDMLEEALNRTAPASAQMVGWRRWSSKEGIQREAQSAAADIPQRRSMDTSGSTSSSTSVDESGSFFRFRFGSKTPASQPITAPVATSTRSHLTSVSVPSLSEQSSEVDELKDELRKERAELTQLKEAKESLEAELEALSQALFEEANRMVADERKMRAAAEEDVRELNDEREAMRNAMRVVEEENRRLRSQKAASTGSGLSLSPSFQPRTPPRPDPNPPPSSLSAVEDDVDLHDLTPTQSDSHTVPSFHSPSPFDEDTGALRIDHLWLDAISPPTAGQFPRPLNLVKGQRGMGTGRERTPSPRFDVGVPSEAGSSGTS